MSKISIMHVLPTFMDASITRIVLNIIQKLGHEKYQWYCVSTDDPDGMMKDIYQENGVKTFFIPGPTHIHRAWQLRNIIKDNPVDILHSHTPKTTVITWATNLITNRAKTAYTRHSNGPEYRRFEWIYSLVAVASLYQTHRLIPVSLTMANELLRFPGITTKNLTAIQNSIDCNYFYQPDERSLRRDEFNLQPDNIVIFFSGRLEQVKRVDLLLDCFKDVYQHHPETRLLIAGIGSLESELQDYSRHLGLEESIIWAGWRTDIPALLAASDIFVQSSLNEGLSLSIIEAMAAGKAIVATEVGSIYEVLKPDKSGIVVPPGDTVKLTEALRNLIENPEKRKQLAEEAYNEARATFDLVQMTKKYEDVYLQLLQR